MAFAVTGKFVSIQKFDCCCCWWNFSFCYFRQKSRHMLWSFRILTSLKKDCVRPRMNSALNLTAEFLLHLNDQSKLVVAVSWNDKSLLFCRRPIDDLCRCFNSQWKFNLVFHCRGLVAVWHMPYIMDKHFINVKCYIAVGWCGYKKFILSVNKLM